MIRLSCHSCGAKLEITDDIERFVCLYCGAEWLVQKSGGIACLKPIEESLKRLEKSTETVIEEVKKSKTFRQEDFLQAVKDGKIDYVKDFIERGAYINTRNKEGQTPLIIAAVYGHYDIAHFLIENGADIDLETNTGITALAQASYSGHVGIVELLISNDADIEAKSKVGFTPLGYAVVNGQTEVVRLLLKKGADVNIESHDGSTPLDNACFNGFTKIAELLKSKGAYRKKYIKSTEDGCCFSCAGLIILILLYIIGHSIVDMFLKYK